MMPTVKLFVRGLEADAEERLQRTLMAVDGVFGVVASHEDACCEVDFEDDVVGIDELIDTARRAGFAVSLAG